VATGKRDAWDAVTPTICVAVPGAWPDRDEVQRALVRESGKQFAMLGGAIVRARDLEPFPCDVIEHDPLLAPSFRVAGRGRISDELLDRIARHRFTVYVRGSGGSKRMAREMMELATALVRAGGLAVKIESSGAAIGRDEWFRRVDPAHQPAGMYWAYVALHRRNPGAADGRGAYSCGMHNFGLRDVVTDLFLDAEALASLMHNFLGLTFQTPPPPMKDGEELSDEESGVVYRVREEPCTTFPPGHMQHNPFGMWRLELVEDQPVPPA
jgi:hypothetical protein